MAKTIRSLLLGYHGVYNVGADSRLKVIIDFFKKNKLDFQFISYENYTKYFKKNKQIKLSTVFGILKFIFIIKKFDVIILEEGCPFTDKECKNWFYNWLSLCFVSVIAKKKIILLSINIEPIKGFNKKLLSELLNKTNQIFVRTKFALKYIQNIVKKNVSKKIYYFPDVALILKSSKTKKTEKIKQKINSFKKNHNILGISIKNFFEYPVKIKLFSNKKDLLFYPYYHSPNLENKKEYKIYFENIIKYLKFMIKKKYKIILLPFEFYGDRQFYSDIKSKLNEKDYLFIDSRNYLSEEIKEIISYFDLYLTGRYHPNILYLDHNEPLIALHDNDKIKQLFEDYELKELLINSREDNLFEKLINKTNYIEKNKQFLVKKIKEKNKIFKKIIKKEFNILKNNFI